MTEQIVLAILETFCVFGIGWLARHLGYIRSEEIDRWSAFVLDILFPLLVFSNIVNNLDADKLTALWPLPVIGFGMMALGAAAGYPLRYPLRRESGPLVRTFHHFCAINNYSFLPLVILANIFGEKSLVYLFLLNVGSSAGYWSIGVWLLDEGGNRREQLKNIFNPNLIALALAILTVLCGWSHYIPAVVIKAADTGGKAAMPCILILIGASIYPFPPLTNKRVLAYLALVRLGALPALYVAALYWLPLDPMVRAVSLIVALMPASVSSTIITRRYGGDPDFAGQAAVSTTVLSVASVAGWMCVAERLHMLDLNASAQF